MLRQRHELDLPTAMTSTFAALLDVAARGRWGGSAIVGGTAQPRSGLTYAAQRGKVLRRGKVIECLRPVTLRLQETLLDPPCCVQLRLAWRVEPSDSGALVLLEARFSLNGAATLRRGHWKGRIDAHCERMLAALRRHVSEPTSLDETQNALVSRPQET